MTTVNISNTELDRMIESVRKNVLAKGYSNALLEVSCKVNHIPDYDLGLISGYGGGNVEWWQDYIRDAVYLANEHWRQSIMQILDGEVND